MSSTGVAYANQKLPDTLVERIRCQNGSGKLDLSLCNIVRIPLQIINDNFDGQTELDLSYNMIQFVSPKFTLDMLHLTRLDLSMNQIKKLPDNFGSMQELVYLDLHKNQLEALPISMGRMYRLRFLRISDNPFRPPLKDFLGLREQGISAVALAGLVVQFLDEFATVHKTPEVQSRSVSHESNRSSKIHYRGRSMEPGPDGDSSTSSVASGEPRDSNNNITTPYNHTATPYSQNSNAKAAFLNLMIVSIIWLVMMPLLIAYFVEASYLENAFKNKPRLQSFWKYYKLVHESADMIISWIPRHPRLFVKGPPETIAVLKEATWGIYETFVYVKDAYVNACWKVLSWLNIVNDE